MLKGAAAASAVAVSLPAIIRTSMASSGELNLLGWAGYDGFPAVFKTFEKATGIKINFTGLGSQDEFLAQAQTGGAKNGKFDICEPTVDRLSNWIDNDFIQPWDPAKIGADNVDPAFLTAVVNGKLMASPTIWGTEALTFDKKAAPLTYGTASLGTLFEDGYAGKLTLRGHSGLAAAGRYLDSIGQLPHPFAEGYKDEAKMVAIWDKVLAFAKSKRKNIAQFWSNENEAQGAFRTNGCVLGFNWDTTAMALAKEGLSIGYLAPKEGAIGWAQNFVLLKGAKNVEQANAWVKWINSAEGSALWAVATGSNPVAKGAVDRLPADVKAFFNAAYPGDALSKIWWWPEQPAWFVAKRTQYANAFASA